MGVLKRELARISFVQDVYGLDEAIRFCQQGREVYNNALKAAKEGVNMYGKVYEKELKQSIVVYEQFLYDNYYMKGDGND